MENECWLEEIYLRAKKDPWHGECLTEVRQLAPAFEAIRASLPNTQAEILDNYIAACEELAHSLPLSAYEAGRAHGKIVVISSTTV